MDDENAAPGDATEFEKEIEALLKATLDQQPGWHELMNLPGGERLDLEGRVVALEARMQAYRAIIFRLAREIAALRGE